MNWIFSVLLLPFLSTFFFPATSSTKTADEIVWNSARKLSWDDFRCAPLGGRLTGAATYASIKAVPRVVNSWNNKLDVEVKAIFRCDKSWAKEQAKTSDYLLNHEQRHFDIAEIFARKIRQELDEYRITAKNYQGIKKAVIEKWFQEYDAYDRSYDKFTVHGLNSERQEQWNQDIDEQLANLPAAFAE